jgi:hypothetical protein
MSIKTRKSDPAFLRSYERGMLRSAFVSLFWAIISARKKRSGYTLLTLSKAMGANKAEVSRWFKGDPNWTVNTIANIADALDVDLHISATERATGLVYTPAGLQPAAVVTMTARQVTTTASGGDKIRPGDRLNPVITVQGTEVQDALLLRVG